MTTVGGAWALNPVPGQQTDVAQLNPKLDRPIYVGEPQIVSQLMGATLGGTQAPHQELRALSGRGGVSSSVVVAMSREAEEPNAREKARFYTAVEELEGEYGANGAYPALPASNQELSGIGYETNSRRFRLSSGEVSYDSHKGFRAAESESETEEAESSYRVVGQVREIAEGWGPWKTLGREFQARGQAKEADFEWLAQAPVTPDWSARMYFPINREQTGYAFRRSDGSSAYKSGELLYDGVSGTFQLRLQRQEEVQAPSYSPEKLERELGDGQLACELAGDAQLLHDLGFLSKVGEEPSLVHLSNSTRLHLSGDSALDGLSLGSFSKHKRVLKGGAFRASEENSAGAVAVGRLELVDKLGQVHTVRVRAGRAAGYDWVVGQLCETPGPGEVAASQGYDDAYQRKTRRTIVAGK